MTTAKISRQDLTCPKMRDLPSVLGGANLLFPLRLIVGWTYFSAFWRRLVLENKLIPDAPGYVGEKFNHFLPQALLIDPVIEFFVTHPDLLWWKLVAFTFVEGIVGLALMTGLFTRLMGLATSALALGILLGAGWLGTTCLDEWQIGVLGVGSGIAFAIAGGGRFSLDHLLATRRIPSRCGIAGWACGMEAPHWLRSRAAIVTTALLCLGLTLWTNQVFHGGVWGKLHNKSVRPIVELSDATVDGSELSLDLYRVEGADVYGSFAIGLELLDESNAVVATWSARDLAELDESAIQNRYVAKIRPGAHSLVIPLGAKATVRLRHANLENLPNGNYSVELIDISGARWRTSVELTHQSTRSAKAHSAIWN